MPEKTVDRAAANGAARRRTPPPKAPEKAPEKVVETARHYAQEAEKVGADAFRMYNDLMATTTNYYFDTLNRTMHGTMELTTHFEHAMDNMTAIYRRIYEEGLKSWETYVEDINKTFPRPK